MSGPWRIDCGRVLMTEAAAEQIGRVALDQQRDRDLVVVTYRDVTGARLETIVEPAFEDDIRPQLAEDVGSERVSDDAEQVVYRFTWPVVDVDLSGFVPLLTFPC